MFQIPVVNRFDLPSKLVAAGTTPANATNLFNSAQEGGGDSIVFELRLLTHSSCQCDVT